MSLSAYFDFMEKQSEKTRKLKEYTNIVFDSNVIMLHAKTNRIFELVDEHKQILHHLLYPSSEWSTDDIDNLIDRLNQTREKLNELALKI